MVLDTRDPFGGRKGDWLFTPTRVRVKPGCDQTDSAAMS